MGRTFPVTGRRCNPEVESNVKGLDRRLLFAHLPVVSDWKLWKALAAGILADRMHRRRALTGFAVALLAMFALGLWGIDDWLGASLWRFAIYWLVCAGLAVFVMLFALFDLLAVLREERDR